MQLVVVGFHRSGTSLLSQLLHRAGLFLGDEMLGAMPSNPYGHFEDREVLELHRAILRDHGESWQVAEPMAFHLSRAHWQHMEDFVQRRDAAHHVWGFKDPRACLFLGQWRHLMPDAKFVVVYRDPGECVRSLETRHARQYLEGKGDAAMHLRLFREPNFGLRMWLAYNQQVLAFVRANLGDCVVLPFRHLSQGRPIVTMINRRLGAGLDEVPTEALFDAGATGARSAPQWVHSPAVEARVASTWDAFEVLARRTEVT